MKTPDDKFVKDEIIETFKKIGYKGLFLLLMHQTTQYHKIEKEFCLWV